MTAYHGGKQRIGKKLAVVMTSLRDVEGRTGYCEPFCGMLGVYQHIPDLLPHVTKYKAGDTNKSLVLMWKKAQKGWVPPSEPVTKEEFLRLKCDGKSTALKGFIGHFFAYMGKYFQPFRYVTCNIDKVCKKISEIGLDLKKVLFSSGTYNQYDSLKNYIIYCDPPYEKQSHYYNEKGEHLERFNSEVFWEWCLRMSQNNTVIVSEYSCPLAKKNYTVIWEGESKTPGKSGDEKLFLIKV